MKKIAVIMSVYRLDVLEYLILAVNSILNQSYNDFDFLIYVDGEVSEKIDIYLSELQTHDARVKVFKSKKNKGLACALNYLIDKTLECSDYEYIARMDSDDISHLNRFQSQLAFMEHHKDIDVCGSFCREFGAYFALNEKKLPTNHPDLLSFSIAKCPFIHPTVFFKKKVFEDGFRYPTNTSLTEDMALWFELLKSGYRFSNIGEVLFDYRLSENTLHRRHGLDKAISEVKIRLKNMHQLKQVSVRNIALVLSRFVFHIMPPRLMGIAYKMLR